MFKFIEEIAPVCHLFKLENYVIVSLHMPTHEAPTHLDRYHLYNISLVPAEKFFARAQFSSGVRCAEKIRRFLVGGVDARRQLFSLKSE